MLQDVLSKSKAVTGVTALGIKVLRHGLWRGAHRWSVGNTSLGATIGPGTPCPVVISSRLCRRFTKSAAYFLYGSLRGVMAAPRPLWLGIAHAHNRVGSGSYCIGACPPERDERGPTDRTIISLAGGSHGRRG